MSKIKGIEIMYDFSVFGVGLVLGTNLTHCGMISLLLGPLIVNINKPKYFRNGFVEFVGKA